MGIKKVNELLDKKDFDKLREMSIDPKEDISIVNYIVGELQKHGEDTRDEHNEVSPVLEREKRRIKNISDQINVTYDEKSIKELTSRIEDIINTFKSS